MQRIAIIDHVCGLTNAQKQKLQLAVRGDIKRLMDRVERFGTQLELVQNDPDKAEEMCKEARLLRRGLMELCNDDSLFGKMLEKLLTAGQHVRLAALRVVIRAGGLLRIRRDGLAEIMQIDLSRTAFADESLAHLSDLAELPIPYDLNLTRTTVTDAGLAHLTGLTNVHDLWLENTRVTDAGLADLKGLTSLQELGLDNTQVTDAGLSHLKGLTSLQKLSLSNTRVTDAGIAQLQRELPGLTISR